jgi:hypothetical protein
MSRQRPVTQIDAKAKGLLSGSSRAASSCAGAKKGRASMTSLPEKNGRSPDLADERQGRA